MPEPPYRAGDSAVRFLLVNDRVEVYKTRVQGIEPWKDGYRVYDHIGKPHEVDRDGVGAELVPMDDQLRAELAERGDGFTVVEEDMLRGLELIDEMPSQSLDGGGLCEY
jgi:hypothetical protein